MPFHTNGRIVFRVRLADGVLVFEWADPMLSIRLDEAVYRVSFYNVSRVVATPRIARAFGGDDGPALWSWDVAYWVSLDLGYWVRTCTCGIPPSRSATPNYGEHIS